MSENIISHDGVISDIADDTIYVTILAKSACSECHAKGVCGLADMQEKVVEIPRRGSNEHKKGDFVNVTMQRSMGLKAVLFGYFIPFLLLMATMFITWSISQNEAASGLISLGILFPYYLGLYLNRGKMKTAFQFVLEKQQASNAN